RMFHRVACLRHFRPLNGFRVRAVPALEASVATVAPWKRGSVPCGHYLAAVSKRTNLPKPANLRSWRVIIIRSKGEYLGSVGAPDRERAEAVAIKQFALDDDQRSRLLIRERL